jgi:hypothetical protein
MVCFQPGDAAGKSGQVGDERQVRANPDSGPKTRKTCFLFSFVLNALKKQFLLFYILLQK